MILDFCKDGLPIVYDSKTNEIVYKDNRVNFSHLKMAYESGRDRVKLTDKLYMKISFDGISFGCLRLSNQQCKSIIRTVCNKSN